MLRTAVNELNGWDWFLIGSYNKSSMCRSSYREGIYYTGM